jgi:hypothetical protein
MNHSYIISRLNDWSLDRIRREDSGIGWPSKLPGYDGMPIGNGSAVYAPNISEEVFETDKCVCALKCVDDVLYEAVMMTYVYRATTLQQKLKKLGCSERTYYNYLGRAHCKLQDFLTDLSLGISLPMNKKPNANFYSRVTRTSTVG